MFRNLSHLANIRRLGTDAGEFEIDTEGYDSVLFLVSWTSDNNANAITKCEQRASTDDSYEDIKGSNVKVGDDGTSQYGWLELHNNKRYLKLTVAENGDECQAVFALYFNVSDSKNIDNAVAATVYGKLITDPVEGTA